MTTLSIWSYASADGAAAGFGTLESLQVRGALRIDDSALVTWELGHPRPLGYQAGCVDGSTALSGAFWGLLFGTVYLAPLAGLPAVWWRADGLAGIGLPDSLLARTRQQLCPGRSALFVLSGDAEADDLRLALSPGTGAHEPDCQISTLDVDQAAHLAGAFGADTRVDRVP